jgi:hypothetical protein
MGGKNIVDELKYVKKKPKVEVAPVPAVAPVVAPVLEPVPAKAPAKKAAVTKTPVAEPKKK